MPPAIRDLPPVEAGIPIFPIPKLSPALKGNTGDARMDESVKLVYDTATELVSASMKRAARELVAAQKKFDEDNIYEKAIAALDVARPKPDEPFPPALTSAQIDAIIGQLPEDDLCRLFTAAETIRKSTEKDNEAKQKDRSRSPQQSWKKKQKQHHHWAMAPESGMMIQKKILTAHRFRLYSLGDFIRKSKGNHLRRSTTARFSARTSRDGL